MSTASHLAERPDEVRLLVRAFLRLAEDQRLALQLKHLEGWSIASLAQRFNRTRAEVARLLRCGLRQLDRLGRDDPDSETVTLEPPSEGEQRLDAILADYLTRADSGQTLDRTLLLEQNPDFRTDLAEFFAGMDRLDSFAEPLHAVYSSQKTPLEVASQSATLEDPNSTAPQSRLFGEVVIPGYEILCELDRGGMGIVYLAYDLALKRRVALKVIRHVDRVGPSALARFRTEAEAVARIRHRHVVQIYELGEYTEPASGRVLPFFALEYLSGGTLARRLGETAQDPRWSAAIVRDLALGLQEAHAQGILHRDLKPSNVLLAEDGTVRIADFGLARLTDEEGQTRTGAVLGTAAYMSPEQAHGLAKNLGLTCDIYSLGAILYECLTGQPPLKGASDLETLELVKTREPVPVQSLQPAIPRDLATVVHKCLEKHPRDRYASAQLLADRLTQFLDGQSIPDRPRSRLNKAVRATVRSQAMRFILFVVLIATLTTWLVARPSSPDPGLQPAGEPIDPREELRRALAGAGFTFAGHEALPGPFRSVYSDPIRPQHGPKGLDFFVDTHEIVLLELLDKLGFDEYEFAADVRHDSYGSASQVGLYFGHREVTPADGVPQGAYYSVAFADRGPKVTQVANEPPRGTIEVTSRFYRMNAPAVVPHNTVARATFPSVKPAIGPDRSPGPWRRVQIKLTNRDVVINWRQEETGLLAPVLSVPILNLTRHLDEHRQAIQAVVRCKDVPTDFRPQAALGLFILNGKASFRNVSLKPLRGG